MSPADSAALRTRASNARRSLEGRLKSEEGRLSALEKEFNGGEPERRIDEFDFQKYLDRVAAHALGDQPQADRDRRAAPRDRASCRLSDLGAAAAAALDGAR